jgi:hypothetical protein
MARKVTRARSGRGAWPLPRLVLAGQAEMVRRERIAGALTILPGTAAVRVRSVTSG